MDKVAYDYDVILGYLSLELFLSNEDKFLWIKKDESEHNQKIQNLFHIFLKETGDMVNLQNLVKQEFYEPVPFKQKKTKKLRTKDGLMIEFNFSNHEILKGLKYLEKFLNQ